MEHLIEESITISQEELRLDDQYSKKDEFENTIHTKISDHIFKNLNKNHEEHQYGETPDQSI